MFTLKDSKHFGTGDLAIFITSFIWGIGVVAIKAAIGDTPETFRIFVFNGLRLPLVSLLLFITAKIRGRTIAIRREHIPMVAAVAFFGMFLNTIFAIVGLNLSTASNMGIINSTTALFILLVSLVTGIERPTPRMTAGIFIGMSGIILLNYRQGEFVLHIGDILIALSCLFFAIYTVYGKTIVNIYSSMVTAAWMFLFASVYQIPFFLYQLREQTWSTISPVNWLNFVIGALGSFYAANVLFFFAVKRIGPMRVGLYLNLQPVITLVFAWLMIGETITVMKIIGLVVILAGIWIARVPVRTRPV